MQLQVDWAHDPTLRSGVAQRPLLGHGPEGSIRFYWA